MAKAPSFKGHKLKIGKPGKDGTLTGKCSCGGWSGAGKTREEIQNKWNRTHINKFDTLR